MAEIYKRTDSPYWWCKYKHPTGQWDRQSTRVPLKFKAQAQLRASAIEVEAWEDFKTGKQDRIVYTFEQMFVEWLKGTKPGTSAKNSIKRLRAFFAGYEMNTLDTDDIEAYKADRRAMTWKGKPISDTTIRCELGTLSSAINWVRVSLKWDIPNPVTGARPSANPSRVRWIYPAQAGQLIEAARKNKRAPWCVNFVELGFNTGMRKMEMLACEIDRVDLLNNCIHLRPEDQKNGQHGVVPLNRGARRAVMRQLSWVMQHYPKSRWLFPSRIGQGKDHISDPRKPFNTACKAADISDFHPHDMRHTFASWLVQRGVPLMDVKEAMRHADIKQTEKYAHLAPNTARRVVSILDEDPARSWHAGEASTTPGSEIVEKLFKNQEVIGRSGGI